MNSEPRQVKRKLRRPQKKPSSELNRRDFGRRLGLYGTVLFFLTLSLLPWIKSGNSSLSALSIFSLLSDSLLKFGLLAIFILAVLNLIAIYFDKRHDMKVLLIASSFVTGISIAGFSGYFFIAIMRQAGPMFSFISGVGLIYSGYFLLKTKWKPIAQIKKTSVGDRSHWVVFIVIGMNALVFILVNYLFQADQSRIIRSLGLISGSPRWYTFFTSIFLHIDFSHFISNMIVLWWVGSLLAKRVPFKFFMLAFIVTGAFGGLSCYLIDPRIYAPILGASGAIAGMVGLGCVLAPNVICNVPYYTLFWCGRVPVRAIWIFALWIMTQSLAALDLSIGVDGNVAYWAHLGGVSSGIILGLIYSKLYPIETNMAVDESPVVEKDLKLSDRRRRANKKNSKTIFPQYLIGTSLLITLLAVYLSYSNFTIMGRMSGFQLAWNKGSVEDVASFFSKESRKRMIPKLERKLSKYGAQMKIGSVGHKISLAKAVFFEERCDAEYFVAPKGVDPYREPGKCGKIYVTFFKVKHVWIVRALNFARFKNERSSVTKVKKNKLKVNERVVKVMSSIESIDGFEVVTLKNDLCQVSVVPALGMKIISLRNLKTSREWMWSSKEKVKLFANKSDDSFANSPLVGADECFPTIEKCSVDGVEMGDHGLIWSRKCSYELEDNELTCTIIIDELNLKFKRSLILSGSQLRFYYELENLSDKLQPYIWAFHPLIKIEEGDEWSCKGIWGSFLCTDIKNIKGLSKGTHKKVEDIPGFQKMNLVDGERDNHFLGGFLTNDSQTTIEINNSETNDSLTFQLTNIPFTNIWLTRGGWNNYHHIAFEPTNACYDNLSRISDDPETTSSINPDETKKWEFSIKVH